MHFAGRGGAGRWRDKILAAPRISDGYDEYIDVQIVSIVANDFFYHLDYSCLAMYRYKKCSCQIKLLIERYSALRCFLSAQNSSINTKDGGRFVYKMALNKNHFKTRSKIGFHIALCTN